MLIFPGYKPTLFNASDLAINSNFNGLLPSIAPNSEALSNDGPRDPGEYGTTMKSWICK